MTVRYFIREDEIFDEDGVAHTVYGIDVSIGGEVIRSIPDVFTEKNKAEKLIRLCNEGELSPIHIDDVVEAALD